MTIFSIDTNTNIKSLHKKYKSIQLLLLAWEVQMLIFMRSVRSTDGSMHWQNISLWKIRETYFSG